MSKSFDKYRWAMVQCGGSAPDAIALVDFLDGINSLPGAQQQKLISAWIATMSLPRDASRETNLVRECLVDLSLCWLSEYRAKLEVF